MANAASAVFHVACTVIDRKVNNGVCCHVVDQLRNIMSGRAVLSDVGSSHTLEVKTTDVTVTRQAHFESSKTSPLVCDCLLFSNVINISRNDFVLVHHCT